MLLGDGEIPYAILGGDIAFIVRTRNVACGILVLPWEKKDLHRQIAWGTEGGDH